MNQNQQIPEEQINPQVVSPDVTSPQGQQQLFRKAIQANVAKKQLDAIMGAVADHLGATTSSRVKNIETATKKIAQKRLQGREYGVNDVNDMLGSRIVVPDRKDIPKAISAIEKLDSAGVFTIDKQQDASHGTYRGYHFDITLGNGTKAEIQIHTPQSELESVANHSLRSIYGEDPQSQAVEQLRNKQAQVAKGLPNDKAQLLSQAIIQLSQKQGGQVSPTQSSQLLSLASQQ